MNETAGPAGDGHPSGSKPVGLVGAGSMGAMAGRRLLAAGRRLVVYDPRPQARQALTGALQAATLAEVALSADVVITCLPNDRIVREVMLEGPDGLVRRCRPSSLIIDLSTSTAELARSIATSAAANQIQAVDAPLLRGGQIIVAGGTEAAVAAARPYLSSIAEEVIHVGGPGAGQATKLVRQYASFLYFFAEAEAIECARRIGLDPQLTIDVLGRTIGPSGERTRAWRGILDGDFGQAGSAVSTLDIVAKDIRLAVEQGRSVGASVDLGASLSQLLARAQAAGWGANEYWAAVRLLESHRGEREDAGGV